MTKRIIQEQDFILHQATTTVTKEGTYPELFEKEAADYDIIVNINSTVIAQEC